VRTNKRHWRGARQARSAASPAFYQRWRKIIAPPAAKMPIKTRGAARIVITGLVRMFTAKRGAGYMISAGWG